MAQKADNYVLLGDVVENVQTEPSAGFEQGAVVKSVIGGRGEKLPKEYHGSDLQKELVDGNFLVPQSTYDALTAADEDEDPFAEDESELAKVDKAASAASAKPAPTDSK